MRISDWSSDVCSSDLAFLRHVRRAGIGGHDEDGVAEIHRLAVMIGQPAIVHHLEQDVEQVRMRLLDLVQQQDAVRILVHRSEEHTSELQSLMRISYAVFCLKKKKTINKMNDNIKY